MNDAPAQPEQPVQPTPAPLRPSPDTPQAPSVTPPVQPGPSQISTGTPDESPLTTEAGKKNKFLKPALIILGIVIVIVISELGYFLFTKKGLEKTPVTEQQLPTPSPAPETTVISKSPEPEPGSQKAINYEKLTNFIDIVEPLRSQGPFFQDATINLTTGGTVTEIKYNIGEIGGVRYLYSITFTGQFGKAILRLTEKEVVEAKMTLADSLGEKKILISEIKPGDLITIKKIIDLLDSSPHARIELEIRR